MSILLASLFTTAAFAQSGPDLTVDLVAPVGVYVYAPGTYTVTVRNQGNRDASNVSVVIQLPQTNTSPTRYTMGTVGALANGCTRAGSTITCSFGTVRKSRTASKTFEMTIPQVAGGVTFTASASTTTAEPNRTNNDGATSPALLNYAVPIAAPQDVHNEHCTGTNLTLFYECVLFANNGAISSHDTTLLDGGGIYFYDDPLGTTYTGSWSHPGGDTTRLQMTYFELGTPIAAFDGYGTNPGCFEGITDFFNGWVSPYEVCLY